MTLHELFDDLHIQELPEGKYSQDYADGYREALERVESRVREWLLEMMQEVGAENPYHPKLSYLGMEGYIKACIVLERKVKGESDYKHR